MLAAGALVAGCASTSPAIATATLPAASISSAAPATLPNTLPASPSNGASVAANVAADPSLLERIPAAKAGLTLTYDPDTTASVAADPSLATDASAIATGLAIPSGQAASPSDFVIVNVVKLRSPKTNDEWFREWRDTYDQAACSNAGGVGGNAEATLGSHEVFIGSCAAGAFTYHTLLDGGSTVVSMTSVGPGRIGEKLMAAIP